MFSDTTLIAVSRQIEQECQQVNLNLGRMWRIFTNVLLSDSKLPILTRRSKKEPYHACKLWLRSVHFCGKVLCATLMLNGFSKALLPIIACLWTRQRNIGEKTKKSSWSVWIWLNNFLYFIAGFISGLTGHSSVSRAFLLAVDRSLWSRRQRKLLEAGLLPVTLFVYKNTDRNNPRRLWFLFRFSDVIFSATNFEAFGHQE